MDPGFRGEYVLAGPLLSTDLRGKPCKAGVDVGGEETLWSFSDFPGGLSETGGDGDTDFSVSDSLQPHGL